ncbi:hypothetical protein [Pseudomonas huanghezhanensis]|uniref:hypothetical protein n=1 Tax=Pseudomonas huanghezhanensis TaxID=3002903 RepID=UPI002285B3DE|nr:hypothetical protein [Pseudomonas sp. BSw22131]
MLIPLSNMKRDLEETAAHFERLSVVMAGHLVFSAHRQSSRGQVDISESIEGIDSSIEKLRMAAAKFY